MLSGAEMMEINWNILSLYMYAVAGAAVLWAKSTVSKKDAFGYLDVITNIIPNAKAQKVAQFFVFVTFGAFVAMALTAPTTFAQALAGGMAWSRLTSAR